MTADVAKGKTWTHKSVSKFLSDPALERQVNVLAAIKQVAKPWAPLSVLECYDGRTIAALMRRGLIEVNFDYGVRATNPTRCVGTNQTA
jgi:hypothetical protein